jgi:CRP-like cAMP-binding protein
MKKFYLGLEKGFFQKSIYPLEGSMTIGRSSRTDITLTDQTVSGSHARISFQQDAWLIEDLGSSNGIIFEGERVARTTLSPGDTFQLGEATLRLIEETSAEYKGKLSETLQVFRTKFDYRSPLLELCRTKSGFERLQKAFLSTPVFTSLGEKELRGVADVASLHFFSKGQIIIREGDPGRSIFIILLGQVRVFSKDFSGREFQLATLEDNQFFGEMSLLTGEPRSSSVASVQECLLSEVSYNGMRRLMLRYPQVKKVMLDYFLQRMEDASKKRAEAGVLDRRKEPRLNERLVVRFTVWPADALPQEMIDHRYKATSSDISLSGIRLEVMGPAMDAFDTGCELRLEIELPQPWGKLRTLGTVRRVIPGEHTIQLGIDFLTPADEVKEKLKEFMYGESHTAV